MTQEPIPSTFVEIAKALGPSSAAVLMAFAFIWFLLKVLPMAKDITSQWAQAHKEAALLCKEGQDEQSATIRQCMAVMASSKDRDERMLKVIEKLEARL